MIKSKEWYALVALLLVMAIGSGCTKTNPAEEIYEHLEAAVSLEATFEEQQEPLAKAENDEYELYEQILELAEIEEIKQLATKAENLAGSRKEMIELEKSSIDQAYAQFSEIKELVEQLGKEALIKSINELIEAMDNRYAAYGKLNEEYANAIDLDLQLYQLVQKEDLTIEELEEQHSKVNASYEAINSFKDQFNQFTIQYNEQKRAFYELAELDVVYQ